MLMEIIGWFLVVFYGLAGIIRLLDVEKTIFETTVKVNIIGMFLGFLVAFWIANALMGGL